MNEQVEYYEQEIDLMKLIQIIWSKLWLIILSTVLVTLLTYGYQRYYVEDEFTANASIIVSADDSSQSDYTDILTGQRLVDTYAELATSDRILNNVILQNDLDTDINGLSKLISVNAVSGTLVINVKVISDNPELSMTIANSVVDNLDELSKELDTLKEIDVVDRAQLSYEPSGPNRLISLAVGFILGGMLGIMIVFVVEFFDNRLKTVDDVEQLGIRVLAVIPDIKNGKDM